MKEIKPLFPADIAASTGGIPIVAGPCSAESRSQVLTTARQLSDIGVRVLRAGVWKPRTRPGSFEGAGPEALEWLAEAKSLTGMATATEVASPRHLEEAVASGIDYIWLGARTTVNPFAVQEIADRLATYPAEVLDRLGVMVKNPVNPDLELWIGALQRLYNAGVRRLGAVHRGFSAYGTHLYRNPPQWRIPIEFRRRLPQVTLLCDPSHIGGRRDLITSLSQQALDMNFDGLIIESHCCPDEALSDAAQQVTPREFGLIIEGLVKPERGASPEGLADLRMRIDEIDDSLLELLARRMEVSRAIGEYKRRNNVSVVQPERYSELLRRRAADAGRIGLDPAFVSSILQTIHEESVRQQLPGDRP